MYSAAGLRIKGPAAASAVTSVLRRFLLGALERCQFRFTCQCGWDDDHIQLVLLLYRLLTHVARPATDLALHALMSASATSLPDLICITDLSLRTPALGVDLWQRSAKSQPLFLSLWIQTSVLAEASTDSLLSSSLNYGSVTKAIEAFVSQLAPAADEDGLPLETLAERLAQVVLFQANAPNVRLELTRPRALLSAESIGVQVSRTTADYESEPDSRGIYSLKQASQALASDKFFVRQLRRSIIIGINPCEREDEQEVIVDLEFWNDDMMLRPWNGARLGWEEWRPVIKQLEAVSGHSPPAGKRATSLTHIYSTSRHLGLSPSST